MIPYASDSDSGSVDLQLSNLEDIIKDSSKFEFTGKRGKEWGEREVGRDISFQVKWLGNQLLNRL